MVDFDRASTTPMYPEVLSAMVEYLEHSYGNPSSRHKLGQYAKQRIEEAREVIAGAINASPDEIYFTSGGSESNNWAIKGLRNPYKFHPIHIVSSNIEHDSVLNALSSRWNNDEDLEFTLVKAGPDGCVSVNDVADSFKLTTKLCSIMQVNNETGIVQPTGVIGEKCRENGVLFHVDAVQGFGHMPIDVKSQCIDLLSASAHKLHGPQGVGFLYISEACKNQYIPLIDGGHQERGLRASTENVAGIIGFATAVEKSMASFERACQKSEELYLSLIKGIKEIDDIIIHGDQNLSDNRHLNVAIENVRAEELMSMLNEQDIYVSAGSACNSSSNKPSHVLKAMGISDDEANSSIRISFDHINTEEEIEYLIKMLKWDIELLRGKS